MPWERKIGLLAPLVFLPWWLLLVPLREDSTWLGIPLMIMALGLVGVLVSKPLGWLDFAWSTIVPIQFAGWWGDSTKRTAQVWRVCLGLIIVAVGLFDLIIEFLVWLVLKL